MILNQSIIKQRDLETHWLDFLFRKEKLFLFPTIEVFVIFKERVSEERWFTFKAGLPLVTRFLGHSRR